MDVSIGNAIQFLSSIFFSECLLIKKDAKPLILSYCVYEI